MKRWGLLLALIAAFAAMAPFGGGNFAMHCVDRNCEVMASSSAVSAVLGVVLLVALLSIPRRAFELTGEAVGCWRMIAALFIDMMLVTLGLASVLALPMLLAEASYSGHFEWSFRRKELRPSDAPLAIGGTTVLLLALIVLRMHALWRQRPSFGQYLMGYAVIGDGSAEITLPVVLRRTVWAVLLLALWPLYFGYKLIARPARDVWDRQAGTVARKFVYPAA